MSDYILNVKTDRNGFRHGPDGCFLPLCDNSDICCMCMNKYGTGPEAPSCSTCPINSNSTEDAMSLATVRNPCDFYGEEDNDRPQPVLLTPYRFSHKND